MKWAVLPALIAAAVSTGASGDVAGAQTNSFLPGHLAVLRAGDGVMKLHLKQSPVFIDQFDPNTSNAAPSLSVQIPTNGAASFFFNGHAATEGLLTRSMDHRTLVFAGYGGVSLLAEPGTPSLLDIQRGFCTVDAGGTVHSFLYNSLDLDGKMNPRCAATDGSSNFWDCGNPDANLYYNPAGGPLEFNSVEDVKAVKIINHVLYALLNGAEGVAIGQPAGIYRFVDKSGAALPLPRQANATLELVVPAGEPYTKTAGFDLSPDGTIAYITDTKAGVEKYVKSGGAWKLAYNFAIPQNISSDENHETGCFGLAVDFSGPAPVIYATTTEGYGGSANSNRVIRIVDTNAAAAVTTLAQAGSENIVFRGIDFTPEAGH